MTGKSIGVYWKGKTLQAIKRAKYPTETFGECCNRLIMECMSHAGMIDDLENEMKNVELDKRLLYDLIRSLNKLPCEFDFVSGNMEEKRLEEIMKEIERNE